MLAMVVLVGMGEHMAERFLRSTSRNWRRARRRSFAIGLLAWLDDFLSALYSFPVAT